MEYILEKHIWTEADFDQMSWHDTIVYKIALAGDLLLDIDYIHQWNEPEVMGLPYTFWLSPATLVFKDIRNLTFDIDALRRDAFEIDYISREETATGTEWTIVTQAGELIFTSQGYELFIRQAPTLQYGQSIGYEERNGASFERTTQQENPYLSSERYKNKKAKDDELYHYAKQHRRKQLELEALQEKRNNNEISMHEYLKQRKELNNTIEGYAYWIKGTRFALPESSRPGFNWGIK